PCVPSDCETVRRGGRVRGDPHAHCSMPQGGHRGVRAHFYDRENRRPQGRLGATRSEGEGRGASPRPQAQDLAGGFQGTRPIVAIVAAMAPNAKVACGMNTTHRRPATTPEASRTIPMLVWYAPRTAALTAAGANTPTSPRAGP